MAAKQALEFLRSALRLAIPADDRYRVALYAPGANLSASLRAYTTEGEVKGEGYTAGGLALPAPSFGEGSDMVFAGWPGVYLWPNSTIDADAALIYNETRNGEAIAVFHFPRKQSVSHKFELTIPASVVIFESL